ncbi:MAG TPA: glycerate kinase [Propionibacteriaceae bacterium]|nr:glycerate kinase [Propionibacteriaceae bacterium]
MRVLILSAGLADLGPADAGALVARAWADLGHQVALVPLGIGGQGLAEAVSAIPGVVVLRPAPGPSSAPLGRELREALDAPTVLVDLTGECPDDAGAGLLAELEGAERPTGQRLVGVVRADETEAPLLGVRGVAARRVYGSGGSDVGAALSGDAALARLAADIGLPNPPAGAGAGNGLALGILALGGVLRTGPAVIAELLALDASLAAADLVVVVTPVLEFGGAGIEEARAAAGWAQEALLPCIAVATVVQISSRELRTFGVESAYELGSDAAAAASRVARTWSW